MGKKTGIIFITGIIVIILGSGYKPLLLLCYGENTVGEVIKVETTGSWFWQSADYYPAVRFQSEDGLQHVFKVGSDYNHESEMMEKVEVLYWASYPQMAAIHSFHSLFDGFFIKVVLSLLIWIAFFSSFNDFFDDENKPFTVKTPLNFKKRISGSQ